MQAAAEFAAEAGQLVFRAVGVGRQSDDQMLGLPFPYQLGDGVEFLVVAVAGHSRQRMRQAKFRIALRHADTRLAEIKRQNRPRRCFMHDRLHRQVHRAGCPAWQTQRRSDVRKAYRTKYARPP